MKEIFETAGEPCSAGRIAEIERNIGRELPAAYRDLIMSTGGGRCRPGVRVKSRKPHVRGWCITQIYGNGTLPAHPDQAGRGETTNSLDSADVRALSPGFLADTALVCAATTSGEAVFAILYEPVRFPPMSRGTVVLFDDQRKAITRVASSFSSFLRKLECDRPVAGFGGPNVPWIDPALSEYLHGQLRDLRISKDSMRTVCDDITRKNGSLSLRKGRQARKLCDFMFYLTTRRRPVRTVQDFLWAPDGALSLSTIFPWVVREFGRGLPGSGEVDRSFVPDWFGARITTDSLVETPHGYRLSDLDEELLLKAMRRAGATWALAEEAEEHDAEQVHSVAELVRVAMTQAGSAPEQDMPDARLSLRLDEAPLRCEVRVDWFGVPDSDEVLKVADEWNRERTAPRLLVDTDSSGHRRLSASMIIVSYAPATRHQIVHWTGWMTASMKAALDFLRRECGNVPVSPWTSDFASSCQNGGDLPVEGNITEGDPPAVTVDRIAQILFGERGEQTVVERFDRHGAGQMRLQTGQNAHIVDLTVHDGLMTLTDGQILGTLDEEQRQLCLSLCATDNLVAPGSTACLRRIWDEDTLEVNLTTYVGAGMDDRQLERAVVGSAAVVGARCAELVDRIAGR